MSARAPVFGKFELSGVKFCSFQKNCLLEFANQNVPSGDL
jgi:hypothetical protein